MKIARTIVLLLVIAAAAWFAWTTTQPKETPPGAPGAVPQGTRGADWDPNVPAPGTSAPAPPAKEPPRPTTSVAPPFPPELTQVGTEAPAGTVVPVTVPWKAEKPSKFRYEIDDVTYRQDQASSYLGWDRMVWRVLLEVREGDGTGAARLRFKIESLLIGSTRMSGIPFEFDSRSGDNGLLDDPELGARLKPLISLVGRPLDFHIAADGTIPDVDGVDDWRDRWIAAVTREEKGNNGTPEGAPARAMIADTWAEYLFPALGGGTLTAGTPAPWVRTQPFVPPWALVWKGARSVVRNDADQFTVTLAGAPSVVRQDDRGTSSSGIEQMRAAGLENGYRAWYRFGRNPGALVQAQIDAYWRLDMSRRTGAPPGQPQYAPVFTEIRRRATVRRTSEE